LENFQVYSASPLATLTEGQDAAFPNATNPDLMFLIANPERIPGSSASIRVDVGARKMILV
jgi:hypothetical protein